MSKDQQEKLLEEKVEKQRKEKHDKKYGTITAISKMIFDNFKLTVKNIYLRYENDIMQPFYSCGMTMNELKA